MHANVLLCCMKVNEGKGMLSHWYPFRSLECLVFKSILYHYIWAHRLANCIVSYSFLEERVTSCIMYTLWWILDVYQKQMHCESEMHWLLDHVNQYGYRHFFFLCWSLKHCCSSNPVSHPPVAISVVPHSIPLASQVTLPQTYYFVPSFLCVLCLFSCSHFLLSLSFLVLLHHQFPFFTSFLILSCVPPSCVSLVQLLCSATLSSFQKLCLVLRVMLWLLFHKSPSASPGLLTRILPSLQGPPLLWPKQQVSLASLFLTGSLSSPRFQAHCYHSLIYLFNIQAHFHLDFPPYWCFFIASATKIFDWWYFSFLSFIFSFLYFDSA